MAVSVRVGSADVRHRAARLSFAAHAGSRPSRPSFTSLIQIPLLRCQAVQNAALWLFKGLTAARPDGPLAAASLCASSRSTTPAGHRRILCWGTIFLLEVKMQEQRPKGLTLHGHLWRKYRAAKENVQAEKRHRQNLAFPHRNRKGNTSSAMGRISWPSST